MKIFFCDLDDTLLQSDKTVSPATKAAIDDFVRAGNIFVISTGRPLSSALVLRDRYGLNYPGSYLSAYNGTLLYNNTKEEIVYQSGIPSELVPELIRLADKYGVHLQSYNGKYVISRTYNDHLAYYMKKTGMPSIIDPDMISELEPTPPKMLAIDIYDPKRLLPLRDEACRLFGDQLQVVFSEAAFCEFISAHAGKGSSLLKLSELLGVPRKDTLAAGDEENDISMIEAAGIGIAMCNGLDIVKQAADVITETDNDHDGLVPFFRSCC